MQEIDRSKYSQNFKFLGQKFCCPSHYHGRPQKLFQEGESRHFAYLFFLDATQIDIYKKENV